MVLTLSAVAENKGIKVGAIEAYVKPQIEETREGMCARFISYIHIGERLTKREQTILLNSARHCEVHKLLSGKIEFEVTLAEQPPAGSQ